MKEKEQQIWGFSVLGTEDELDKTRYSEHLI